MLTISNKRMVIASGRKGIKGCLFPSVGLKMLSLGISRTMLELKLGLGLGLLEVLMKAGVFF